MEGLLTFADIQKPDVRVSSRATREAIDTQLDLEVMLAAAVYEQARYFHGVSGRFLEQARQAFRSRHMMIGPRWFDAHHEIPHVHRIAEIFAATRILGRARIRKEVGLPMARPQFAEVLQGIGVAEAVDYIKSLPVATQEEWRSVVHASAGQAFVASGVENKAATEALRNLVAEGLQRGWTEKQFETAAQALLNKFETEAGALRTLWNTTTASAMAKGREEELNAPDVVAIVSYRMYDAILDFHTRPNHRALDGGIAPWDWEGWLTYAPPNGFNCRCTLIGITGVRAQKMLDGSGFDLSVHIPFGAGPDIGFDKAA